MKTQYRHPNLGNSLIWPIGEHSFRWSNSAGSGHYEGHFESCVLVAQKALMNKRANEKLSSLLELIPNEMLAHAAVCEFSSDDNTTTLHIDLETGYKFSDLPKEIQTLDVVLRGEWHGGKSFSFQFDFDLDALMRSKANR